MSERLEVSAEALEHAAERVWPDAFADPNRSNDQEYARSIVSTVIATLKEYPSV